MALVVTIEVATVWLFSWIGCDDVQPETSKKARKTTKINMIGMNCFISSSMDLWLYKDCPNCYDPSGYGKLPGRCEIGGITGFDSSGLTWMNRAAVKSGIVVILVSNWHENAFS